MSRKKPTKPAPGLDLPPGLSLQPEGYAGWLLELKGRIYTAQQRAALAVNRELVLLYWQIGRDVLVRQARQGWGTKSIDHLAHDLRTNQMVDSLPPELQTSRPSIEQIES
ncbi:hypothetical protein JI745_00345 [Piscinibacter sp. HJYY11]|nr:hypothetical protein [Piscinibacter sp. HJYY11]